MNLGDDDLDLQYNPRTQIPDFVQFFGRWKAQSAQVRTSVAAKLDLPFGPASAEKLDYFPARGLHPSPLLMFIHGGYWRALDKDDFSWIAPAYVDAGIGVAVLNYGLLPATPLAEIVAQIRRAVIWLYRQAEPLGIDSRRLFCSGHSAGGHLTAMMLATDWQRLDDTLPPRLLAGAITVSGIFDVEPLTRAPFLRADLNLDATQIRLLSPVQLPLHNAVPLDRAVGERETNEFHRQSHLIVQHWPSACVTPLLDVPGCNHLSVCDDLSSPNSVLFQHTRDRILGSTDR